jgi:hypothetical protein
MRLFFVVFFYKKHLILLEAKRDKLLPKFSLLFSQRKRKRKKRCSTLTISNFLSSISILAESHKKEEEGAATETHRKMK